MKKKRYCIPIDLTKEEVDDLNNMEFKEGESRSARLRLWIKEGYLRSEGKVLGFRKEDE